MAGFPLPKIFEALAGPNRAVESLVPRRTFQDVILPPSTRRSLEQALAQVTSHDLIFNRWGLGQRHPTGLALAFNFAGPSGTGTTPPQSFVATAPLVAVRDSTVGPITMNIDARPRRARTA